MKKKPPLPPEAVALAKARKAKGLTQVQLAVEIGVSKGTVGGWESGDHGIHPSRVRKVATVVDLDPRELVPANLRELFA